MNGWQRSRGKGGIYTGDMNLSSSKYHLPVLEGYLVPHDIDESFPHVSPGMEGPNECQLK